MDGVNVQIYKIDIGKLIFVKKKILILIEILRKLQISIFQYQFYTSVH
jgi:hypothetical protein